MITSLDQATPQWITLCLQKAGVLNSEEVVSLQIINNAAFNSQAAHLVLGYSHDVPETVPQRVFLKLKGNHDGEMEVKFYAISEENRNRLPMLVRCWDAEYEEGSGDSYCLLEDHSVTHQEPISRQAVLSGNGVPSTSCLESIVDIVARFHACWWEHAQLGQAKSPFEIRHWFRDDVYYQALIVRREQQYSQFLSVEANILPTSLRRVYDTAIGQLPKLWEKYLRRRILHRSNITLTHGDCYFSQFLVAGNSSVKQTFMVDFDSVSGNFGAYDLAYLFPTFWTSAQRREENREITLLQRYHQQLLLHGVRDYSWENLLLDYRLMVTHMLFDPFIDYNPQNRTYWWPKMQCLAAAYQDLECDALLER